MQPDRPEAALLAALESAWMPQPGRQAEAYRCEADVLLYGGAAGGGKSDLLLGLAHTRHQRSIIFRREFAMLGALEDRARELLGGKGSWNGQDHRWRLDEGRVIEFGAVQLAGDVVKYQGRPHDLIGFDEVTHFTEEQFRFLIGWLRSPDPAQRKRVVAAGNPPTSAEGDWVIRYWAPWLDHNHPNPAQPGELRWFATIGGKDVEVESGEPFDHDGELIEPMSRTFIPASLADNPILERTGYRRTLQNLPEPLRSQLLYGDFGITQEDDAWQVIPTAWVIEAQARWTEGGAPGPMEALGVDVARGGRDKTVLTPRHGAWFGPQICEPGSATPDGPAVLRLVADNIQGRALVSVDVIGVGGAVVDLGRQQGLRINPVNGAAASNEREVGGNFGFANKRAELYWRLREALDPASGQDLALPPDRELRADLTAPRWKMTPRGVQIESKEDIARRIGRSPDKGDSLVYAMAQEPRMRGWGMYELARREAEGLAAADAGPAVQGPAYAPGSVEWLAQQAPPSPTPEPAMVRLKVPGPWSHVHGISGRSYPVRDGIITVNPEDAAPLRRKGYELAEEN